MKIYKRLFAHEEPNLLNTYWSEKCFQEKLQEQTRNSSVIVMVFNIIERKRTRQNSYTTYILLLGSSVLCFLMLGPSF